MMQQAFFLLIAVVVFGVGVPWIKGYDFLDPIFILGYACLGVLFVTPAATEVLAEPATRSRSSLKMLGIWAYGWGLALILIASGILTVNSRRWTGHMVMPSRNLLLAAAFLGAAACLATVAAGAALARRSTPKGAKTMLRFSFLTLLLLLAVGYRFMPETWRTTVEENLTTVALTHFAVRLGAILAVGGAAVAVWALRASHPSPGLAD